MKYLLIKFLIISDDVHSQVNYFIDDRDDGVEKRCYILGKKRKKFKNVERGNIGFLLRMIIITIGVEIYFFINYFLGSSQTDIIFGLFPEFNATMIAESYYIAIGNAQK